MTAHLKIIATGFRIAGLALIVLSLAGLADLVHTWWTLSPLPQPDNGKPLDIGTYGLIALLDYGARGFGFAFHAIGVVFMWLLWVMVAAAAILLLFAILLYFVGRGIGRHATWARVVAIAMSASAAFSSVLAVTTLHGNIVPVAAVPLVLSLYTLWVLVLRFN